MIIERGNISLGDGGGGGGSGAHQLLIDRLQRGKYAYKGAGFRVGHWH
jgi:hypothetical protein